MLEDTKSFSEAMLIFDLIEIGLLSSKENVYL